MSDEDKGSNVKNNAVSNKPDGNVIKEDGIESGADESINNDEIKATKANTDNEEKSDTENVDKKEKEVENIKPKPDNNDKNNGVSKVLFGLGVITSLVVILVLYSQWYTPEEVNPKLNAEIENSIDVQSDKTTEPVSDIVSEDNVNSDATDEGNSLSDAVNETNVNSDVENIDKIVSDIVNEAQIIFDTINETKPVSEQQPSEVVKNVESSKIIGPDNTSIGVDSDLNKKEEKKEEIRFFIKNDSDSAALAKIKEIEKLMEYLPARTLPNE